MVKGCECCVKGEEECGGKEMLFVEGLWRGVVENLLGWLKGVVTPE